jgi:hypothetical protein
VAARRAAPKAAEKAPHRSDGATHIATLGIYGIYVRGHEDPFICLRPDLNHKGRKLAEPSLPLVVVKRVGAWIITTGAGHRCDHVRGYFGLQLEAVMGVDVAETLMERAAADPRLTDDDVEGLSLVLTEWTRTKRITGRAYKG